MRQLLLLLAVLTVGIFSTEAQEYRYAKRGYFGTARVSATNVYSILTSSPGFSAEVINGYSFNKWFMMGVGVGVVYSNYKKEYNGTGNVRVPLYLHLRANVLDRKVTPYFTLNMGGGFCKGYQPPITDGAAEEINGSFGFYCLEPQVGVAVRLKGGRMLDLGLSLYSDVGRGFNGFPKLGIGFTW